jgi:lipoprotein NlpD
MTHTSKFHILVVLAALGGCASSSGRAPVVDIGTAPSGSTRAVNTAAPVARLAAAHEKDWRPQTYVVQKGDTLFSIAFNFGFDYHDLAQLNGIQDPSLIHVGQELRLFPASGTAQGTAKPAAASLTVGEPKAVKLPYSEQAMAQLEKMQQQPPKVEAKAEARPVPAKPEAVAESATEGEVAAWGMPANGKVIAGFSENDGRKGIDIAGKLGQPVFASAGGKVVYSGSGLRGYGKLVIIKHNSTFLSAYAHNDKILVKEGQSVSRGQKIAEMGNTDASRVELHFEIRKLGKPVDPAQYLNLPKS